MPEKGTDGTHFSFAFRASGATCPAELVQSGMELFAKEVLPTLRSWGREPTTGRAPD